MYNVQWFNVGLKRNDFNRNVPADRLKDIANFRANPIWFDGDDPYDGHSLPIAPMHKPNDPYPNDRWFAYEYWGRFPRKEQKTIQLSLPHFLLDDDSWYTPKIKRRSERLHYGDVQFSSQDKRGSDIFMHEIWAEEELKYKREFDDIYQIVVKQQKLKKLFFQPRKFDQLLRYTKDDHDLERWEDVVDCPPDEREYFRRDSADLDVIYGPNERNKKTLKYVCAASHFWHDHACKYRWDPDEDHKDEVDARLEVLPPDPFGTMCIIREYYDDNHRKVGPILRALTKAAMDDYQMIVVEPHYFSAFISNWIEVGDLHQKFILLMQFSSCYYMYCYPGYRYRWGFLGWMSLVLYSMYTMTWELSPLNNYDYFTYHEREELGHLFPPSKKYNVASKSVRCFNFDRFPCGILLNRTCLFLTRRKFPFNIGFKKFYLRCTSLVTFGMMVAHTGWPVRPTCLVPCVSIPFLNKDGTIDSLKWQWVAAPRLLGPRDLFPGKATSIYDYGVFFLRSGLLFGLGTMILIYYNCVKKERFMIPFKYYANDMKYEELAYFDFGQTVKVQSRANLSSDE